MRVNRLLLLVIGCSLQRGAQQGGNKPEPQEDSQAMPCPLALGWAFQGEGTFLDHSTSVRTKAPAPDVSGATGIHLRMLM